MCMSYYLFITNTYLEPVVCLLYELIYAIKNYTGLIRNRTGGTAGCVRYVSPAKGAESATPRGVTSLGVQALLLFAIKLFNCSYECN